MSEKGDYACFNILSSYPLRSWLPFASNQVGIGGFIVAIMYLFSAFGTIYWVRRQRTLALEGMEGSVKNVQFPIYDPFLYCSAGSDFLLGVLIVFVDIRMDGENSLENSLLAGFCFALQHFVIEGIAFLLFQDGLGVKAFSRAIKRSIGWALFTFVVQAAYHINVFGVFNKRLNILWTFLIMVFYFLLWVTPVKRVDRRPSLIFYSKFWFIFRFLAFVAFVLLAAGDGDSQTAGACLLLSVSAIGLGILKPIVLYYTLLLDSMIWQAVNVERYTPPNIRHDRDSNSSTDTAIVSPLRGFEVGYDEAQNLANEVDNFATEGRARLINHRWLSLKESQVLGNGSFSKVFVGKYKGEMVAIKMLFTPDLNEELVQRSLREATILTDISHPNVVHIYGVSIRPPSVCIVLEICPYGSLADVTRGAYKQRYGIRREPLSLNVIDKLFLAVGCCRGLAAVHDNGICHRDVKSFNFLVDANLTAKIADLELGGEKSDVDAGKNEVNRCWLAPEILRGEEPTQASDVYSLSLVLWEIFSAQIPFENMRPDEISRQVREGIRPFIAPGMVPFSYLLERGWDDDPELRPTAAVMSNTIEAFYRGALSPALRTTDLKLDMKPIRAHYNPNHRFRHMNFNKFPETKASNNVLAISRDSEHARHGEAFDALLSMDSVNQFSSHLVGDTPVLPTLSETLALWQRLDNEIGACAILSATECVFEQKDGSKMRFFTGYKRPVEKSLAVFSSQKFLKLTGYLSKDVVGTDLTFICGPRTNRDLYNHAIDMAALKGESGHVMLWLHRRDGTPFHASMHTIPVFSSSSEASAGIRGGGGIKSATGGTYFSSIFSSHKKVDVKAKTVLRRTPSPTQLAQSAQHSYVEPRESDVNSFRPSFLRPDDTTESPLLEPLLTAHPVADGPLNFCTHITPSVVQGCVTLSLAAYRDHEAERLAEQEASYHQRWEIFDSILYERSPVLFVVVHFNAVEEPPRIQSPK